MALLIKASYVLCKKLNCKLYGVNYFLIEVTIYIWMHYLILAL